MAERKFFDVYKRIPVVGQVYGTVRGIAYSIAGNEEETKHSVEMDLADLNPLRMPRNIVNGLRNAASNLHEDIWLGKRSLGDQPFSLTVSPGLDLYHWCIQIDGVIYEVAGGKNSTAVIQIISEDTDPDLYKRYCSRFAWTKMPQVSQVSNSTLRKYAKSFEQEKFMLIVQPDGINCQFFVAHMLAKAADITFQAAKVCILAVIPNILF